MPKVSVIIPVYNTGIYIRKCIDSIKNQTLKDIEIIVINDGSKDNSEKIIEQYVKENKSYQIKYYKKENGGLFDARNFGVQYATGDYISFIDSDDYIESNLYKTLEKYMEKNIDVIKFKMQMVNEQVELIQKTEGPVFEECTGEEAYKKLCVEDRYMDPACIYLYRREFFINHNFKYRLMYHEDFGLTSFIIANAKSFVSTDVYGYYYLQTANSLTRTVDYEKSKKRAKDLLNHYDYMIENIDNYDIGQQTKKLIKRYYTNSIILKANTLKKRDSKKYIKELKTRKIYKNIEVKNLKQLIKKVLLKFNIRIYLKIR